MIGGGSLMVVAEVLGTTAWNFYGLRGSRFQGNVVHSDSSFGSAFAYYSFTPYFCFKYNS